MLAEERRQLILSILQKDERVVAKDLADQFQLSVDSIRRDLTMMEEMGLLKKTYGGAMPVAKVRTLPQTESIRYGAAMPHQHAISKLAASYIQSNDAVFIGGAGIHYGMLTYLPKHIPFTIVTNSLKIAQCIREYDNIDSYLIGGKLRAASGNMIDPLAIEQVRKFSLDICFVTGGGLSAKGISTATPEGASFTRAVCDISRKKIGLAPHEKIGIDMFACSVTTRQLDLIITDAETAEEDVQKIKNQGVEVIIAPVEHN
ncbi:DeoR/GlpR family DNA-binding transcription regulator [Paenibacillus sp. Soil787]|uniref:DeoR/GlpR family DNA-binding transcription regulator n=1 Tax=Paenibacillus sp. Soil787 TaxID=1736411 RepID=UPI0006F245D3|nr:DeoR/GlpR family DNA-binding transcription regulator [Paenibacillus sp. Soil787]KRF44068.1 cytochrome C [Paenibacillus sp. Soil787]